MSDARLICADVLAGLAQLEPESVQCVVTSPPYFGLRDYGVAGQIGLEASPEEYVARLVEAFRAVRQVLRPNGVLWLNLGDCYAGSGRGGYVGGRSGLSGDPTTQDQSRIARGSQKHAGYHEEARQSGAVARAWGPPLAGLRNKELVGIPWMVAFALRADGWLLRADVIWHKPNPMPESTRDRPTRAHEYLFLLSKSGDYFYDYEAVLEPAVTAEDAPRNRWDRGYAPPPGQKPQKRPGRSGNKVRKPATGRGCPKDGLCGNVPWEGTTRNRRSVWTVATSTYPGAHFATFPPRLIEPCVLAGSARGDLVLDPFCGSGTTGAVALEHGRRFVGIDVSEKYLALARARIAAAQPRLGLVGSA